MRAISAHELDLARRRGLEPAERQETVRAGLVHLEPAGPGDPREGEHRLPRLAWLERLQDQLGESVAERKR